MPVVLLPRSLIALFPGAERRYELDGTTVDALLEALDGRIAGLRERLVDAGPRLRPHINVYVDGNPAALDTAVGPTATVHIIPAVSGGAGRDAARREFGKRDEIEPPQPAATAGSGSRPGRTPSWRISVMSSRTDQRSTALPSSNRRMWT